MVDASNSLRKNAGDVQHFQLRTHFLVKVLRHRVCHDDLVQGGGVYSRDGIAAEDAMCHQRIDLLRPLTLEKFSCSCDGVARVQQIVDQNAYAPENVAY